MVEYYKVEKNPINSKYYLAPTAHLLQTYEPRQYPFCYTSLIIECYNFFPRDFYKYLISKYDAKISVEKIFPYFKTYFAEKRKAEEFCKEVNERIRERQLV